MAKSVYKDKPGGNVSTSGSPYDMLKGSTNSPDTKAYVGGRVINGNAGGDTEYGLSNFGPTPEGNSDSGVYKWETTKVGTAPAPNRSRPKRKSSQTSWIG
jgi:hypothetical protein